MILCIRADNDVCEGVTVDIGDDQGLCIVDNTCLNGYGRCESTIPLT